VAQERLIWREPGRFPTWKKAPGERPPLTEVLFYHLQRQPLEAVLPTLVEKSLERGWRVAIQVTTEERLQALDDHLWTYTDEGFLPHGTDREADAADQPAVITVAETNPNRAAVRFLVEGAPVPEDAQAYDRLVIMFDGNDQDALLQAREQWRTIKAAGHDATYWQQDESGRWRKKA
jgi:DNA polymerase-3 subunit chi